VLPLFVIGCDWVLIVNKINFTIHRRVY
jgi:hypothetical protein